MGNEKAARGPEKNTDEYGVSVFKVGDKLIRTGPEFKQGIASLDMPTGYVGVVSKVLGDQICMEGKSGGYRSGSFELLLEQE